MAPPEPTAAVVKVPAPSASMLYSNLCALSGGGVAYIHKRQVILLPWLPGAASGSSEAAVPPRRVEIPNASNVHSICACRAAGAALIALGSDAGLQVWDEAGSSMLFSWGEAEAAAAVAAEPGGGGTAAAAKPPASCAWFVRGLAFNASAAPGRAQLCAGTSAGGVHVFDVLPGGAGGRGGGAPPFVRHVAALAGAHAAPVSALATDFQSRRGGGAAGGGAAGSGSGGVGGDGAGRELVSCDEGGGVVVWAPRRAPGGGQDGGGGGGGGGGGEVYEKTCVVEGAGPGAAAAAVRGGLAVVARVDGTIRIYGLLDGGLRCEIAAHARWASALDLHPSRDLMASVSEDCSIAAWKLPITPGSGAAEGGGARRGADCSAPAPVLSAAALGRPLAGVAFCGEGCGDVAAAAYDGDDLLIWKGAGAA